MKLNNKQTIPDIGLGLHLVPKDLACQVVQNALALGYRQFDTDRLNDLEAETAEGIVKFLAQHQDNSETGKPISRQDVFFSTKIAPEDYGYDKCRKAVLESLDRVKGLGYIDLVMLHYPGPSSIDRLEAYRALQDVTEITDNSGNKLIRSIGVSNFDLPQLEELMAWQHLKIVPAVNQVELNPWLQRVDTTKYCKEHKIVLQAFSPLISGRHLDNAQLLILAERYQKTPAQILIRWSIQSGFIPLPKSVHRHRLHENLDVFDFTISQHDIEELGDPEATLFSNGTRDPSELTETREYI